MDKEQKEKLEMKFQVIQELREYLMGKREPEKRKKELSKSKPLDHNLSKESHL